MTNLVEQAAAFAEHRHDGQRRKYTNEPYFVHLAEVAGLVRSVGARDEVVAAAYLHDILEDTHTQPFELRDHFGEEVMLLVLMVTDVSTKADGNRAVRKARDREHAAKASPDGQTIKLADIISNTASIVQHDPGFAKIYLREMNALLSVLTMGNPALLQQARHQCQSTGTILNPASD